MEKPTYLLLPLNVAQQIAKYLSSRPYGEVAGIMGELQKLPQAKIQEEEKTE